VLDVARHRPPIPPTLTAPQRRPQTAFGKVLARSTACKPPPRTVGDRAVNKVNPGPGGTVGVRCDSCEMDRSAREASETTVETITASALRIGDELLDGPAVRHVTGVRLQGAPPEACVELAGVTGWRHYTAASRVQVHRSAVIGQ